MTDSSPRLTKNEAHEMLWEALEAIKSGIRNQPKWQAQLDDSLASGADVNKPDDTLTPLAYIMEKGLGAEAMATLVKHNAILPPLKHNFEKMTGTEKGSYVTLLRLSGNLETKYNKKTALQWAIGDDDSDAVFDLIAQGAEDGMAYAVASPRDANLRFTKLIEKGVNPYAPVSKQKPINVMRCLLREYNDYYQSAIRTAVKLGFNFDHRDADGLSCIDEIFKRWDHLDGDIRSPCTTYILHPHLKLSRELDNSPSEPVPFKKLIEGGKPTELLMEYSATGQLSKLLSAERYAGQESVAFEIIKLLPAYMQQELDTTSLKVQAEAALGAGKWTTEVQRSKTADLSAAR